MRKIMLLAAVVTASWMLSQPPMRVTAASVSATSQGTLSPSCTSESIALSSTTVAPSESMVVFKSRHFRYFGHRGFSSKFGHAHG
jgi:hypothetical protein